MYYNVRISLIHGVHLYLYFLCTAAISNLNGIILYGQKIHVTLSKHAQVQMPQAGSNVCSQLEEGYIVILFSGRFL